MAKRMLSKSDNIVLTEEQTTAELTLATTGEVVDVSLSVPSGEDMKAMRKSVVSAVWKDVPSEIKSKIRSGEESVVDEGRREYQEWIVENANIVGDMSEQVFALAEHCVPVLDAFSFKSHYNASTVEQQEAIAEKMMFLCGMKEGVMSGKKKEEDGGRKVVKKPVRKTRSQSK